MRILSAADAISPAFARTKLVLFTPFRWGRSWKLAATGYLSFAGTIFFPFMLFYVAALPTFSRSAGRGLMAIAVGAIVLFVALYCVIFLLCSRLQFAFFDIVLNRGEFVAPAWRKYGPVSWRWTWMKVLVGLAVMALITLLAFPLIHTFIQQMASLPGNLHGQSGSQLPPAVMMDLMAEFYGMYFGSLLVIGLYYLGMSTASAFMVPSMALEGLSPSAAFRRMIAFIRQQTGAFFGFVGMRLVLGIAGYMGVALAYEIAFVVLALVFGLLCWIAYFVLQAVHVPVTVMIGLGITAGAIFAIGVGGYLSMLSIGAFFTFFEAHTLYFLGGRYPLLGHLLDASTPPPNVPPSPAYAWAGPYQPPPL